MELTGRPYAPVVTSPEQGSFPNQYTLTWEVKSYSPVIYYDVFFRNVSQMDNYLYVFNENNLNTHV